ncbi:hypothetical protein BCR39DRAFT_555916 [Naematelia encephala]|uniref:Uncharacterized protein n=1 Tax=Naematelia encephala TaxID=71784 RepID=A0A1Y2BLY1_9TREE|nr:hypothetical protein BCR39DRAFT_555916 [Naematelia encephala]
MDGQSSGEAQHDAMISEKPVHSRESTVRPLPHIPRQTHPSYHQAEQSANIDARPQTFTLPHLPSARESTSSLLDAVVGVPEPSHHISESSQHVAEQSHHLGGSSRVSPTKGISEPINDTPSSVHSERLASDSGSSHETGFTMEKLSASESSWDVLSDASSRINEEEAVRELEGRVQKRRSNLPYLESQLAALEAKIKAAEERLAKAQGQAGPTQQEA